MLPFLQHFQKYCLTYQIKSTWTDIVDEQTYAWLEEQFLSLEGDFPALPNLLREFRHVALHKISIERFLIENSVLDCAIEIFQILRAPLIPFERQHNISHD